jgi:hypothetical protein
VCAVRSVRFEESLSHVVVHQIDDGRHAAKHGICCSHCYPACWLLLLLLLLCNMVEGLLLQLSNGYKPCSGYCVHQLLGTHACQLHRPDLLAVRACVQRCSAVVIVKNVAVLEGA